MTKAHWPLTKAHWGVQKSPLGKCLPKCLSGQSLPILAQFRNLRPAPVFEMRGEPFAG